MGVVKFAEIQPWFSDLTRISPAMYTEMLALDLLLGFDLEAE